jgi:2-oxoisovalerate dehydrogenase E1 component beta subunit
MCEWAFIGLANGAAMMGLKPVVEIQFADFISTGFDPIVQYAATTHYRWGAKVPLVIRAPWGGGSCAGPFHSQCKEAWFAHCPGLKVVIPSTPYDAKGLLLSAIRDPNPVIFFEPKHLYRRGKSEVPEEPYTVPIGKAEIRRPGCDLSIITWGAMVQEALGAAETLSAEGAQCEVIDLRTIVPLDRQLILDSVRRTSRVLIVHEAVRTGGFGAEVVALLAEEAFDALDAPPARLTAPDTPVPCLLRSRAPHCTTSILRHNSFAFLPGSTARSTLSQTLLPPKRERSTSRFVHLLSPRSSTGRPLGRDLETIPILS